MSPTAHGMLVVALLATAALASLAAWAPAVRRAATPAAILLLALAAVASAAPARVDGRESIALLVFLGGVVAVAGGGPVTASLFGLVDRRERAAAGATIDRAGRVLRGGTWIGLLERAAIYATLLAGWPEGLAVTLAIKGLGRYPELRAAESAETTSGGAGPTATRVDSGAAERFIIGTFASVLWAAACAGVVTLVRG